jgi:hypothetical protein
MADLEDAAPTKRILYQVEIGHNDTAKSRREYSVLDEITKQVTSPVRRMHH